MVKISSFIIGAILCSLFVTVFSVFIADSYTAYAPSQYDNTSLATFDKLEQLNDLTQDIQHNTTDITQENGILDVVGGFFSSGYKSLKVATGSITTVTAMSDDAFEIMGQHSSSTDLIKTALISILLISIFIGVILSAIMKKDV